MAPDALGAVKPLVRRSLDLVGLLPFASRTKAWVKGVPATLRSKVVRETAPDGLPVPPPQLRETVAGTTNLDWFLTSGKREVGVIEAALAERGLRIDDFETVLDFGCGCGRVLRYWHDRTGVAVHGIDYNPRLIKWCRANLPFASFGTNGIAPPSMSPTRHMTSSTQSPCSLTFRRSSSAPGSKSWRG